MSFVDCNQVVKAYRVEGHEIVALRGIDFDMERGEMVSIIGPSGAGKSSLLNLLGGLDKPTAGQLLVDGLSLLNLKGQQLSKYRLWHVGFVWQDINRNLFGHRSALHNVTLPMMLAGVGLIERRKRARELLHVVGLEDFVHASPAQLSGGQQQRVAIAVALANNPSLLLADEPTGALDKGNSEQVMALLADLRSSRDLTVLMVTHDLEIANYADRVLTLRDGALGQDISSYEHADKPHLDESGRVQLPEAVRKHLASSAINVEIRPEGVLLRPNDDDDDSMIMNAGALEQDEMPKQRGRFRRLLSRLTGRSRSQ